MSGTFKSQNGTSAAEEDPSKLLEGPLGSGTANSDDESSERHYQSFGIISSDSTADRGSVDETLRADEQGLLEDDGDSEESFPEDEAVLEEGNDYALDYVLWQAKLRHAKERRCTEQIASPPPQARRRLNQVFVKPEQAEKVQQARRLAQMQVWKGSAGDGGAVITTTGFGNWGQCSPSWPRVQ